MSVDSSGESYRNSEYVKSPKNLPTRSADTLQLKSHILELQHMHKVAEDNIDDITQPEDLFTQPDKLGLTELAEDGTAPDKKHQYNGASPWHVTRTGYYGNWYSISSYVILWFLCARYDVTPPNLHRKCGGCGTSVDVRHVLIYSKGGLITTHHNKVRSKLLYLAQ